MMDFVALVIRKLGKYAALLFVILFTIKAAGIATYAWIWTAAPIGAVIAVIILVVVIMFFHAAILELRRFLRNRKQRGKAVPCNKE